MKLVGIGGIIITIIIFIVLALFTICCLILSSRCDNEK